mmetsp:Transcript_20440/g.68625  ORF Transcript_20440/g.68625 Transcript_20440/m.68625 type:complete len:354 (-) Transcript_20440:325-1386(-)
MVHPLAACNFSYMPARRYLTQTGQPNLRAPSCAVSEHSLGGHEALLEGARLELVVHGLRVHVVPVLHVEVGGRLAKGVGGGRRVLPAVSALHALELGHHGLKVVAVLEGAEAVRVRGVERRVEGRWHRLALEGSPVDALEEGVAHDLRGALRAAAQALLGVGLEEGLDEVHQWTGPVMRLVVVPLPAKVEEQLAQGKPVHRRIIALLHLVSHFRGHVALRAAHGPAGAALQGRGHAQVHEAHVAVPVEHHIGRLEVPVEDLLAVHVAQREHELRGHEADGCDGHSAEVLPVAFDVEREGGGREELEGEEEVRGGLEAVGGGDHEGVVAGDERQPLAAHVVPPPARPLGQNPFV